MKQDEQYTRTMPEMRWMTKPYKGDYDEYTVQVVSDKALTTSTFAKGQVSVTTVLKEHLQGLGIDAVEVKPKMSYEYPLIKNLKGDCFWYKSSDGTRHYCPDDVRVNVFWEGVDEETYNEDMQSYQEWSNNIDYEFYTKATEALCLTKHSKARQLYDLCKSEIEELDPDGYVYSDQESYEMLWDYLCKFEQLLGEE